MTYEYKPVENPTEEHLNDLARMGWEIIDVQHVPIAIHPDRYTGSDDMVRHYYLLRREVPNG